MTLYATFPYDCPYLPDRTAVSAVYDPGVPVDSRLYGELIRYGFRRSGPRLYRPHCPACSACESLRIPSERFRSDRSQRRIWRRNADIQVNIRPAELDPDHFDLYRRYQKARHPGGEMDFQDPEDFERACLSSPVDTRLVEMRDPDNRLLAVAITDFLPTGLSAMYTFFEPTAERRSLGTYAILWQIDHAREAGYPHVYLGYWIRECAKMAYKNRFRPAEVWTGSFWRELEAEE
ncbi:arginyltransferase [Thiohalorhabdus methylotrophus]|uniref:Aspartate/glutamate leucyltransferase n=1 Tax=Thiohalorhabdus methylotrophus TaxID=3242694 RepID=A0ABV4TTY9_9GAMM